MNDPDPRRARIRRLFGYTLIPYAEFDDLIEVHQGLADAALVMHSALERISTLAPYLSARPAIHIARASMKAALEAVRPRR